MLFFLFGDKSQSSKKKLTFTIKPNELEDLANVADALKGKLDALGERKKIDVRDKDVRDFCVTYNNLRKRIDLLAKKSI